MSETRIIIDVSALHPDHYPRIKKMLKNSKLKRAKVYVVDLIDGLSIALNILSAETLRKQYPAALSGPLKVASGESSVESSTRY